MRPIKGQMLALRMDPARPLVNHVLWAPGAYLVPRLDGRLLVGATEEEAGFDARPTAGGIVGLLEFATRLVRVGRQDADAKVRRDIVVILRRVRPVPKDVSQFLLHAMNDADLDVELKHVSRGISVQLFTDVGAEDDGFSVRMNDEAGTDIYLVLDGVIRVERDGEWLAEYGPGALLGERAHLEGGTRTSTLVTVTPCRVASVEAGQLDRSSLVELSGGHRREHAGRG